MKNGWNKCSALTYITEYGMVLPVLVITVQTYNNILLHYLEHLKFKKETVSTSMHKSVIFSNNEGIIQTWIETWITQQLHRKITSNNSDLKQCPESSTGITKYLVDANNIPFMRERYGNSTLCMQKCWKGHFFHFFSTII